MRIVRWLRLALLGCAVTGAAGAGAMGCGGEQDHPATATAEESEGSSRDGRILYERFCRGCHGQQGEGNGFHASMLAVKPRDFSKGLFKLQSRLGGMPSDKDLSGTISRGIPGTEMGPLAMPRDAVRALVDHVKSLTVGKIEIEDQDEVLSLEGVREIVDEEEGLFALVNWFEQRGVGGPVEIPEPPAPTRELVELGRSLFVGKGGCAKCHGETGAGDGPSAEKLEDDWGYPVGPRDLSSDPFKGGADPKDLYLRVMVGMPGTPMPSSVELLTGPEEAWALVYYVKHLAGQLPPLEGLSRHRPGASSPGSAPGVR